MFPIVLILDAIRGVPGATIKSFSIGPHPFASVEGVMSRLTDHRLTTELLRDQDEELHPEGHLTDRFTKPFGSLDSLRLAYYDETDISYIGQMPENVWFMLTAARESLRHLSITRVGGDVEYVSEECSRYPEESDFMDLHFPFLRSLELHHLKLPDDGKLRVFLKRHSSTLRELRLVDCFYRDGLTGIDIATSLAGWGRRKLNLTGIEYVHAVDLTRLANVPDLEDDEDTWTNRIFPPAEVAIRHIERVEKFWIRDRANTLPRTVDVADRVERAKPYNVPWWLRPSKAI